MRPQRSCTGSAFIVDVQKRHIMTNAHVVSSLLKRVLYTNAVKSLWYRGQACDRHLRPHPTEEGLVPAPTLWFCCCEPACLQSCRYPTRQLCMCGDLASLRSGVPGSCVRETIATRPCSQSRAPSSGATTSCPYSLLPSQSFRLAALYPCRSLHGGGITRAAGCTSLSLPHVQLSMPCPESAMLDRLRARWAWSAGLHSGGWLPPGRGFPEHHQGHCLARDHDALCPCQQQAAGHPNRRGHQSREQRRPRLC